MKTSFRSILIATLLTAGITVITAPQAWSQGGPSKAHMEFLEANKKKDGVKVTDSGLQYRFIKETKEGRKPNATDTVKVHYRGTLVDGTEFDSSYKRNEPISFPLNRVIPGWTEGVQLMSEGDKVELVIPHNLAYGDRGVPGAIPPFSVLIFEIELLEVQ